jgi:50S ribosomal protein L16 3-hydroxylase
LSQSRLTRLTRSNTRAGARNWTLLVNGVNHFSAPAEELLRRFSFIAQARLDDVMVSYAAPGGGVGPHFDSYDVFLVQGSGHRLWRLARPRPFALLADAPLRLIEDFRAEEEYLLGPGDMLYLPPGWGHDGVALDSCFTYSVGFRAPLGAELAASFLDYLHERGLPDAAYRDPDLRATRHPARIAAEISAFAQRLLSRISWRKTDVEDFIGRYLSTPKPNIVFSPSRRNSVWIEDKTVALHPKTQLLYLGARFFINGESFTPRAGQRRTLAELADRRQVPGRRLARAGLSDIVRDWHRSGFLLLNAGK